MFDFPQCDCIFPPFLGPILHLGVRDILARDFWNRWIVFIAKRVVESLVGFEQFGRSVCIYVGFGLFLFDQQSQSFFPFVHFGAQRVCLRVQFTVKFFGSRGVSNVVLGDRHPGFVFILTQFVVGWLDVRGVRKFNELRPKLITCQNTQ